MSRLASPVALTIPRSDLRIGSLCTGYGGLDHAVMKIFGGNIMFVADNAPAAATLLACRYPGIHNAGDITSVDWRDIPDIDILTGGFPCQPISIAGRKRGEADERWLWPEVARAIRDLRPQLVVLENVGAILGRGLDTVLGSLAEIRYDARWMCVRASDVGAPHRRERWFAVAYPRRGWFQRGGIPRIMGSPESPEQGQGDQRERAGNTPVDRGAAANANPGSQGLEGDSGVGDADGVASEGGGDAGWGVFVGAIRQWERVTGRSAPPPVVPGRARPRLNPRFSEWMIGLPDGWVTGVPGLTYADQLHLVGNGVVPQQAAYAISKLV